MMRIPLKPPAPCLPLSLSPCLTPKSDLTRISTTKRRGAFTVIVLVCLLISTMVLGSLLKIALLRDRQLGREFSRVQTNWLADSGMERAASRLAADPAFSGETWKIDADRLGERDPAVVVIRIEPVETQPHQRRIVVEAVYPAQGPVHARITRQANITLTQER